ncbi:MAG TPA: hypothetical protein VKA21_10715, partial [Candidatus Binatia bacterium]|nr:hypothetical protein [Candidatus Binatia bacterium]
WSRALRNVAAAAAGGLVAALAVVGPAIARTSVREFLDATILFVLKGYAPSNSGRLPWAGVPRISAGGYQTWLPVMRSLPVFLAVEAVVLAWTLRRRRGRPELERLCLLLLAIVAALGVAYFPDYIHVAFVAPFFLIVAARVVHCARTAPLARRRVLRAVPRLAFAACLVALALKGTSNLRLAWHYNGNRYESAIGPLDGGPNQGALVERVRELVPPDATGRRVIFVYPSEPWLYLALPADNPTPYGILFRGYNSDAQYARVFEVMEHRPVDYAVVCGALLRRDDPVVLYLKERYDHIGSGGFLNLCKIWARKGRDR